MQTFSLNFNQATLFCSFHLKDNTLTHPKPVPNQIQLSPKKERKKLKRFFRLALGTCIDNTSN